MKGNGIHAGSRTASYQPTHTAAWPTWDQMEGMFLVSDVERMDDDPRVLIGFAILRAPVAAAQWVVECDDADVEEFIDRTITHFWQHDLTKALGMLKYGSQGGELVYQRDEHSGLWEYDTLKDFHIHDTHPLDLHGSLAGVRVYGVRGSDPKCLDEHGQGLANGRNFVDLLYPSCFWLANEAKHSSYYGKSRYKGAWKPWKEKRGKQGAVDVRRNWMIRNACRGAQMRFPEGTTEVETGKWLANQDVAREMVEKYMAGFVLALPGDRDEKGEYAWVWIEPKTGEDCSSILKYPGMLDVEILEGMEIQPEVLQAPDVGSGWSGRSIPFLQFLGSEDPIVNCVLTGFVRQAVRPLVHVNYGPQVRFRVKAISLLPKETQQQQARQDQKEAPAVPQSVQGPAIGTGDGMNMQPTGMLNPPEQVAPQGVAMSMGDDVKDAVSVAVQRFQKRVAALRTA